jgi:hypothetical protein
MALTYKEADEFIAAFLAMRDGATDALASIAVDVYPELNEDGELLKAGTRIKWNGTLKRAAVDLWDTAENNPDNAPTLWEDIAYKEGYRIIPEVITVGTAFALNECGWWNGVLYKSTFASNVYTPAQYPAGWELVK